MTDSCSVVVMAAGKGTRMKSAVPKVLHSLCGRTLLGHAMTTAQAIGPAELIVVVRHERDLVAAEALAVNPAALVADQDDIPGTGRAVQCGLEAALALGRSLGDTVVVTSGDVPLLEPATLQQLVDEHRAAGAAVTLVTTISDDPTGYGRVLRDGDNPSLVSRIVEHKDASDTEREVREINAGIYAFDTAFLLDALGDLGQENSQGEVYLTDLVALAVARNLTAVPYVLEDQWQAEGCNDLAQLATLRSVLTDRICQRHMLAGVSIVDPKSVAIDVQVELAADSTVEPFTVLRGETRIEVGAVVGPHSTLIDARVGEAARVAHSYVAEDTVEPGEVVPTVTSRTKNLAR